MTKLIMGIGMPGAGKTTVLKPFAEENDYTYISADDIREEMNGNPKDQSNMQEVWQEAYQRVAKSLDSGKTVVFDGTFIRNDDRQRLIRFAREHGAEKIQGVFMATPIEIINERNLTRDRIVPEHAMKRMESTLRDTLPVVEDGFDSVFDLNEFGDLKRLETDVVEDKVFIKEFKPKLR